MRDKSELRQGQQDIATALYEHDEMLCIMRPGGGKTISTLTAILELGRDRVIRHALVTAPKRVARVVWPDEIAEWKHVRHLRYDVMDGGPGERQAQLKALTKRHLTIFGHDIIDWVLANIKTLPDDHPVFDLLVIDEISRFRNPRGAWYKVLKDHVHRWRMIWGLSGTLRPASPLNLFCPARLITRGKLWGKKFDPWQRTRFYHTDFEGHHWIPLPGEEEKLNAEIAPLIVTADVPKESEPTVIFDRVELPPAARDEYTKMERKLFSEIDAEDGKSKKIVAVNKAVSVGKLGQIANGFLYDSDDEDDRTVHWLHGAKRDWLKDLVENATEPMLLIYQYKEDFRLMRALLPDVPYLGVGVSDKQAAQNIRDWNAGQLPFMGLHPASAGHGLNLQFGGADMAWIAPTWDSELWDQTIERLDRPGQTRQVIIRVCMANRTVDDLKIDRVYRKLTEQEAFERYVRRAGFKRAA